MQTYKNLSGTSGVIAYEFGQDYIDVEFEDRVYRYNYAIPGRQMVETMKTLAASGEGLATFINQKVRENYAAKLR
ncbi:MAG TPA: hypothetical protein VHU44_09255 [Acidobacteriaceae bacterium]|jgi:hypothetical protein|nr:hypothetical protein [Acidobacteriaceae bacterium]